MERLQMGLAEQSGVSNDKAIRRLVLFTKERANCVDFNKPIALPCIYLNDAWKC
jgi:hypothetical protein